MSVWVALASSSVVLMLIGAVTEAFLVLAIGLVVLRFL